MRAPTPPRSRCGWPTRACRCSAGTASSASTRSRCGTATRARSACSKARSLSNPHRIASAHCAGWRTPDMIDFTLTEKDRQLLDQVRAEALVCRKHARYYDEHEEEVIPDEIPEDKDFPN